MNAGIRWEVRPYGRRDIPGCTYRWATVKRQDNGITFWHPRKTWQEAMDYANEEARLLLEEVRHFEVVDNNGWPQLAGCRR